MIKDHTLFSAVRLGFALLCQSDNLPNALAVMQHEDNGGECDFDLTITNPLHLRQFPPLGAIKTVGNEEHLHGHPGESLAAS
eukprot:scaffold216433_cov64-Attheya_sp.AAC.2